MRVLHVIPSLDLKEGGPSFAVIAMAEALAVEAVEVTIATTRARGKGQRAKGEAGRGKDEGQRAEEDNGAQDPQRSSEARCLTTVVSFPRNFESYKVSFGLAKWLSQNVAKFDLVHIHALFSFSSAVAARAARR